MESNNSDNYENSVANHKSSKGDNYADNHVNGLSNGFNEKHKSHKSEHKDKYRDKDKDRDKHRSKDHKSSSKDKDKDKHRHSSSSSHHKSSSSKDKDRERGDREKSDKHKGKSDKDKERSGDKEKDRSEKDKERSEKDKERSEKDKERSDKDKERKERSEKDKERGDKDKERSDKDKDRHKDEKRSKEKDHKSSSKDKDKDKEHKSSSKDKSRDKDKDKDKHKHSSSKDKDRHSSKDKHRDKEKHSSSKDKKEKDKKLEQPEDEPVKTEIEKSRYDYGKDDSMDEDEQKLVIKEEGESHDEEELKHQNVSQASSCDYSMSQFKDEPNMKEEDDDSEEDMPLRKPFSHKHRLAARLDTNKRKIQSDDDDYDDAPIASRKKIKKEKKEKKNKKRIIEDDEVDFKAPKKEKKKIKKEEETDSPKKKKKKEDEVQEVWKWWEEDKKEDGKKWKFLEHKGPVFAPDYDRLPDNIKFYYDGDEMRLSKDAEEVAGFYARMLDHDYTTKDIFNNNFFKDWRKSMTDKERAKITDLRKCNFKSMHKYFLEMAEKNRNKTKEEKAALKAKNEEIVKEYGFCTIDGHKEKIGNFKIEPPGLFRGRGEHPKMGMLKRRVLPEDVLINCSKDSKIPKPPPGHKWKDVKHDDSVTWLASWTENVQNQVKYVMLNPSSKLKGEKDWQKYETARRLHKCIDKIRREYKDDWKSKEMRVRQRAVALYFIDKLALRAGNEKDEDQADTVGCCSLRVEHIQLHETKDDRDYVVCFDFLGKDSIRYYNEVPVEKRVFKNLQLFMENKAPSDDLFDRLNTTIMNKHLNELMEGLTAKVFRTYNASFTLQQQLEELTNPDDTVSEKILSYNRANRAVAILCNHQRSVPKGHEKSMEKLKEKIEAKREQIQDAEKQVKDAHKDAKHGSVKEKVIYDKKKKMLARLKDQLVKLTVQETDRDENKTIALGTSKLNYLDPRISVAWCKKYDVPIEKIYNKTQRDKFRWAIDMAGPDYVF